MTETAASIPTTRRMMLILVTAAVAFYWSSMYLYMPTLPVYARTKIDNLAQVGVVLSMYGLWQAVVRLPLGIAADWIGRRKPFILLGFILSALGAYLMATADGYTALLVGRAVTGLAAAAWVPLAVLFSGLFPPAEAVRAAVLLSLVNGLSRMLSTSITGSLNALGGYPLAFFAAVGMGLLAVVATLPVREQVLAPRRPDPRGITRLITRPDVLLPALLSAVGQYITWTSTFGFLPILAANLGASGQALSMLISLNLAISMLGNLITSTIGRRMGNLALVYISFAVMALGLVAAALAQNLTLVFIAQVLIGFGGGINYPLCMGMSIERVDEPERATAMGLHQAVYATGMFAGPWLSGILARAYDLQPMFAMTAAGTLAIGLLLAQGLKRR